MEVGYPYMTPALGGKQKQIKAGPNAKMCKWLLSQQAKASSVDFYMTDGALESLRDKCRHGFYSLLSQKWPIPPLKHPSSWRINNHHQQNVLYLSNKGKGLGSMRLSLLKSDLKNLS